MPYPRRAGVIRLFAAPFFLVRESLREMEVPSRQFYEMAVIRPAELLAAAGITNLAFGTSGHRADLCRRIDAEGQTRSAADHRGAAMIAYGSDA